MNQGGLYQQGIERGLYAQQQQCLSGVYAASCINSETITNRPNITVEREPSQLKRKSMFCEIATDIKTFFLEHRGVIYFIIAALIIDHIFFKDAFRLRLQGMADKIVAKVENKIAA